MQRTFQALSLALGLTFCGCRQNSGGLTDEQAAAVESAVTALKSLAGSSAGAMPAGDLQDFIDNFPDSTPTCPTLGVEAGEGSVSVTLDFGESCSPQLYPDAVFGGSITGTVDVVTRTVALTMDSFLANEVVTTGSFVVSAIRLGDGITFEGDVDLTVVDAGTVTGSFNVDINVETGVITVRTATLEVSRPSTATVFVVVDDLVIDPASNDNFTPESGTAIVSIDAGDEATTVNVVFTESTPTDGTVRVSVNDGPEFSYTLDS